MEPKEWRIALDRYLLENTMSSEDYESMTIEQKYCIQEIKKALKRINSKQ